MPKRILIVDDEADFIQLVQYRLQVAGYEAEFATRGFEAINKALTVGQYLMLLRQRQRLRKSGALPVPVRNAGPPRFGVPASVGR